MNDKPLEKTIEKKEKRIHTFLHLLECTLVLRAEWRPARSSTTSTPGIIYCQVLQVTRQATNELCIRAITCQKTEPRRGRERASERGGGRTCAFFSAARPRGDSRIDNTAAAPPPLLDYPFNSMHALTVVGKSTFSSGQ